ncbi:hypothetical protein KAR91_44115 [Candidatus Pacearchaeota archaeon]|nr:hypothetical protein [Candidatus Pacearchaeota archaeon]
MAITQNDLDQHQLNYIRRERDALMYRINAIDSIEVCLIKMMKNEEKGGVQDETS